MAYKIGSNTAMSNTGVTNSTLPSPLTISSTKMFSFYESHSGFVVGDNRILVSNVSSVVMQFVNSNEFGVTFSANSAYYYSSFIGVYYNNIDIGDGLIVVGNYADATLNVDAGSASVYDYNGNLKYTLYPSTNVVANISFGHTVSIGSNLISVCSFESNVGASNAGTIYVYYSNGSLKSKTYRPISPGMTVTNRKAFRGVLIDGYRILASDLFALSSNSAVSNAGAIYLFATDNTHIFTANQQVDIGAADHFGSGVSYSDGIIAVGSSGYESQNSPYPLNDGLVTGISIYGDLVYRKDVGFSGQALGASMASGSGYVAASGDYDSRVGIFTSRGEFVEWLYTGQTQLRNLQIYDSKLYFSNATGIISYDLPKNHNSYYNYIIKNKARYY